jgi:hypothetical protein
MKEAQYWHTWKETVTHLRIQLSLEQFQQLPSSPINIFIPLINIHQKKKPMKERKGKIRETLTGAEGEDRKPTSSSSSVAMATLLSLLLSLAVLLSLLARLGLLLHFSLDFSWVLFVPRGVLIKENYKSVLKV